MHSRAKLKIDFDDMLLSTFASLEETANSFIINIFKAT